MDGARMYEIALMVRDALQPFLTPEQLADVEELIDVGEEGFGVIQALRFARPAAQHLTPELRDTLVQWLTVGDGPVQYEAAMLLRSH